jgi:hypothetical protein
VIIRLNGEISSKDGYVVVSLHHIKVETSSLGKKAHANAVNKEIS